MIGHERHLEIFQSAGEAITALAREVDLDLPVEPLPGWDARELVLHCGRVWTFVHRSIDNGGPVGRGTDSIDTSAVADPAEWHAEAHAGLAARLRADGPDAAVWTFNDSGRLRFWQRRMAMEAALHRWDLASVNPEPDPIEPDAAVDGLDELFDHFVADRRPDAFAGDPATIHLHATDIDGEWVITRGPEGIEVEHAHRKGDVAARGPASDLMLMMWNRIPPTGGGIDVFGDGQLLTEWQEQVRF